MSEPTDTATQTGAIAPEATTAQETIIAPNITTQVKSFINDKGEFLDGYEAILPEDVRDHSVVKNKQYKNLGEIFKSKISADSMISKKVSEYLDSNDPTVVKELKKRFEVPEKAEDYKLNLKLPEGYQLGTEGIDRFRKKAAEIGLPQKFAEPLAQLEADLWVEKAQAEANQALEQKNQAEKSLRDAWKGDSFDKNTAQVKRLIGTFGLTEADLNQPIGNNPALIKALFEKVVPLFGEDKLIEGTMQHSMASAEDRIKQLNVEMFRTPQGTPEYRSLISEKTNLMKQIG
jgi:hypothetical protein